VRHAHALRKHGLDNEANADPAVQIYAIRAQYQLDRLYVIVLAGDAHEIFNRV
jgi:hypothetical protein